MSVIRTIRDAELSINQILNELGKMRREGANSQDLLQYVTRSELDTKLAQLSFAQRGVTLPSLSNDTDSNVQNSVVYHNLRHYFREPILSDSGLILPGEPSDGKWTISTVLNSRVDLAFQHRSVSNPSLNFDLFIDPAGVVTIGGIVAPTLDNTFDNGNSSLRWKDSFFAGNINQDAETTRKQILSTYYGATAGTANTMNVRRARGTYAAPTDILNGDRIGSFVFQGYRTGAYRNVNYWDTYAVATGVGAVAGDTQWITTDLSGASGIRWVYLADGHIIPYITNTMDLGRSTERVRKLWAVDIDFSGTITGVLPSTDANTSLSANASASPTLTTSFADLSGASVTLNKNGTWLITANIVGSKELNDDEIQAQYVYDGSAVSGIIRMAASSATFMRSTGSRSWIQSVTSQPKVAKLQVKKNSGTGFSTVDATNSNITAVFLAT